MPILTPDPSVEIQITERPGPWILWEPVRASARREGLLCMLRACANPDCPSADVMLSMYPIDTGLLAVEWTADTMKLSWAPPAPMESSRPVRCNVDVCRATFETDDSSEYAQDVVQRLRRVVSPIVLDRLHDELCEARGLPRGTIHALPEHWAPGELIPWYDLHETPRHDLVDAGGRTWLAIDYHCPLPRCDCKDAIVDFVGLDAERRRAEASLGTVTLHPGAGGWKFDPENREDDALLRECWRILAERFGDVSGELERRRQRGGPSRARLRKGFSQSRSRPLQGAGSGAAPRRRSDENLVHARGRHGAIEPRL